MQDTIRKNDSNVDAYLSMNYLLMNLLVEEHYDPNEHDYYAGLLKKYFIESYAKFFNKPEYLFFIGKIASISEWYFDIELEEVQRMIKKAANLEPENILYQWSNYSDLDMRDSHNKEKIILYAKQALSEPKVKEELKSKGALGKYLWDSLEYWSKEMTN
jgi:hypothetical protein